MAREFIRNYPITGTRDAARVLKIDNTAQIRNISAVAWASNIHSFPGGKPRAQRQALVVNVCIVYAVHTSLMLAVAGNYHERGAL